MSETREIPKKLQKTLERLRAKGESPVLVLPAIPRRYRDERSMAMARIGMFDEKKIRSWLVVTDENLFFVRIGLLRNRVESFPLERITDVEYVKEFQDNTIKIRIGNAAEDIRFYDEGGGIKFYRNIKHRVQRGD